MRRIRWGIDLTISAVAPDQELALWLLSGFGHDVSRLVCVTARNVEGRDACPMRQFWFRVR